mmetsp:Transcript_127751/g.238792  ORF Transcript_127751/g.238792 Transcript_127751/m.238792 type:complete len:804 (-) Transcript_127751:277-2688(-)
MSVKKRIKPGRIEPSTDGNAIVVHFTTETTHLDEDGLPLRVDKSPDKREVSVIRAIKGAKSQDIPSLAQEIVEKCKYIPASKTRHVEQVLVKLHAALQTAVEVHTSRDRSSTSEHMLATRGHRESHRESNSCHRHSDTERWSPGTAGSLVEAVARVADVLPEATFSNVDDYADELYEEKMEAKALGAQRLLRLCTEARHLESISEHSTLLGVLSRELRENAKRSHELAVAITGIFLCFAHFSQFHEVLVRHQCSDVTMRVVEYESKRRTVLQKELEISRGRMVARGSQATKDEHIALDREERRYRLVLDRQDRLLQLCLMVLRNLAENVAVERKFVGQRLCHFLVHMLSRHNEDLLIGALSFLHKLVAFEVNKDQLLNHQADPLGRLAELAAHPSMDVALLSLRVCFNLSFDARARSTFVEKTGIIGTLAVLVQRPPVRKVALKLLYHLSMDEPARAVIADRYPGCIALSLELVVQSNQSQVDRDVAALCVNLSANEACAGAMVQSDLFRQIVVSGVRNSDPLLLKVLRHVTLHVGPRTRLLEVMQADGKARGTTWLHELVRLAVSNADSPNVLLEALGILSSLECSSPEVPWAELCEIGLLDLLSRLMMLGFSDDDVLLECVMLVGVVALDPGCTQLLAASKVLAVLPNLLTEKQEDNEIMVQLLFTLRCLLLQEDTCEVLLHETDTPDRILELMRESGGEQVVQAAAEETLDLIVAVDTSDNRDPHSQRWAERIKAFKFELHNDEWCQRLTHSDRPQEDLKSATESRRSFMRWTDTDGLADRYWGNMPGFSNSSNSASSLR